VGPLSGGRRVVVDASVVLGVLDGQDALHRPASEAVTRARAAGTGFVLPATVLAEVLVGVARLDPGAVDLRREQLRAAFGEARAVDADVAAAAARRCADAPHLRLADALVLAVADVEQADEVLTADARMLGVDGRIRVVGR
jgi:predicted nucleic acid-binding protein